MQTKFATNTFVFLYQVTSRLSLFKFKFGFKWFQARVQAEDRKEK